MVGVTKTEERLATTMKWLFYAGVIAGIWAAIARDSRGLFIGGLFWLVGTVFFLVSILMLGRDGKRMVLSPTHVKILTLLSQVDGSYGFDLMNASRGALQSITIYLYLRDLREAGLVDYEDDPPLKGTEIARRRYRITDAGRKALGEATERLEAAEKTAEVA
jgi:hypothetical protein